MIFYTDQTLELLDTITDLTKVYAVTAIKLSNGKRMLYTEKAGKTDGRVIRIFLSEDEASVYQQTAGDLYQVYRTNFSTIELSVSKMITTKNGGDVACVLSTVDIDGIVHNVDLIMNSDSN